MVKKELVIVFSKKKLYKELERQKTPCLVHIKHDDGHHRHLYFFDNLHPVTLLHAFYKQLTHSRHFYKNFKLETQHTSLL